MHASIVSSIDSSVTLEFELVCDRISLVLRENGVSLFHINVHKPTSPSRVIRMKQARLASDQLDVVCSLVVKHGSAAAVLRNLLFREILGVADTWKAEESL